MHSLELNFILLVTFLQAISTRVSESTWSANQEGAFDNLPGFQTRIHVNLLYHNDSQADYGFYEWKVPSVCNVSPENFPAASLTCPQGVHVVSAVIKALNTSTTIAQERFMPFVKSPFCYQWYAYIDVSSNRTQDSSNLRIWIVDPKYQSYAEGKGTAETPSEHSLELTRLFAKKGQLPHVREVYQEPFNDLQLDQVSFSHYHGYWIIPIIFSRKFQYVVRINGKTGLAVEKCFVWPTDAVLAVPKFNISQNTNNETVKGSVTSKVIIYDPCASHVAVAMRENTPIFFTQDGFETVSGLQVTTTPFLLMNDTVTGVVFTSNKMCFLMQSGKLFHLSTNGSSYEVEGVKTLKLKHMVGKETCLPQSNKESMDPILSWNDEHVYLTQNGFDFIELKFPKDLLLNEEDTNSDVQVIILDAAFATDADHVVIIFRVNRTITYATVPLLYSLRAKRWERLPFWLDDIHLHNYRIKMDSSSVDSFLLWNDKVLLFSKINGHKRGTFRLAGDMNWCTNQSKSDVINSVVVFDGGKILVQMSSGAIFWGNLHDEKLTSFPGFSEAEFVYHDPAGSVYSVSISSSGSASKQLILKTAQFTSAFHPHKKEHPCKFLQFEAMEDLKNVYYFDRKDRLQLWSRLTYSTTYFNDIEVNHSHMSAITVESSEESSFYPGRRAIKRTITISSNVNFYESNDYYTTLRDATGIFSVHMKPKQTGLSCLFQSSMIAHVAVGCPPERHVRIEKPSNCSLQRDDYLSSVITGKDIAGNDQVMEIDFDKFGCPFVISDRETFKPAVYLYDGDELVEEVPVDFIVLEIQGRSDFTYNASESLVGCQSSAQSWRKISEFVSQESSEYEETWGPHNYRPCFTSSNTTSSADRPYGIMNKSGISALTWDERKDRHLFLFRLKVIDPHYSFCSLEDNFAVEVRGSLVDAKQGKEVIGFVVVAFAILTLSLGLASYAFFRRDHIEEWKRNQAEERAIEETAEDAGEEMTQTEEEDMASKVHARRLTVLER